MRVRNNRTVHLRRKTTVTDSEGAKRPGWATAVSIDANVFPASGRLVVEMYGARVATMLGMLYDGGEAITEGDGICVNVGATAVPDFRVVAVRSWSNHRQIDLEKVIA